MIKKISLFIIILGLSFIGLPLFNSNADEVLPVYSNNNLASHDLEGKEYLGDGVYRVFSANNRYYDYNVYNGNNIIKTTISGSGLVYTFNFPIGTYTITVESNNIEPTFYLQYNLTSFYLNQLYGGEKQVYTFENVSSISLFFYQNGDLTTEFKLQIEKGDISTLYTVPLQPYLWHEKQLSYNEGYVTGYDEGYLYGMSLDAQQAYAEGYASGYDVGYDSGFSAGKGEGYDEGYNTGYHYGMSLDVQQAYSEGYDKGFDDGVVFQDTFVFKDDTLSITLLILLVLSLGMYLIFKSNLILLPTIILWLVFIGNTNNNLIILFATILFIITIVITFFSEKGSDW